MHPSARHYLLSTLPEADILAGRKTITIRDKWRHFKAGDILRVSRFEDNQYFCTIEAYLSVSPITLG